ncbi:MAG: DUF4388 domain-containing protein [Calditrichia bacterium]|nr:DUF4388 domain-containing protein [Calditrichota bacterium]MCB0270552.1 DUF4388 domain-containing protein [Calditrichota bacterium]MCB0287145.1 DUF4388 domain-containing protein [Calditrichota bacterium]MCB9070380.1 DUF4388 domain-containing protein [Calditrichia bacterium]
MALVGNLKDLKLANIIQINCIERNTARVVVRSKELNGLIYFADGGIVHAEYGLFIGERAVHEMLALSTGDFKVESDVEAPRRSIQQPWNSIVLEGLRLLDEKREFGEPLPRQLLDTLSGIKNINNFFVLNYNGQIIEGSAQRPIHPITLTFVWYKLKKMLNLFYTDKFQYVALTKPDGYYFVFEHRPNLVVIETNFHVIIPDFAQDIRKIIQKMQNGNK